MKNVLILAYECAPHHRSGSTIGAQRPYQFAKHLPKFGWNAIVLCCDFSNRYSLSARLNWKDEVIDIVESKMKSWDNSDSLIIPLPSLRHADFVDRLWMSSVWMDNNTGTFVAKSGFLNLVKRKITTLLKLFRGDHSQSWQEVAYTAATQVLGLHKIDFVMAEHGPDASVFVASRLYNDHGIDWGIDFRDPLLAPLKKSIRPFVKLFYNSALLKSCSVLFNVNPYWVELDNRNFSKKSILVTNGFDEDEFKLDKTSNGMLSESPLLLLYFGSIKPDQRFDVLFEAISFLRKDQVGANEVVFYYYGPSVSEVLQQASYYKVLDYVSANVSLPRLEILQKAREADLLILLARVTPDIYFRKGFYPGKMFEYFALRKNIVSIPKDNGQLDQLLMETKTGNSYSDPNLLAKYLRENIERKRRGEPLPSLEDATINNYTRAHQTSVLASTLDSLTNPKKHAF